MCDTYYFQNLWRELVHMRSDPSVSLCYNILTVGKAVWLEKDKQTVHALSLSQKQLKPKTLCMCDGAGTLPYLSLNSGIHKV